MNVSDWVQVLSFPLVTVALIVTYMQLRQSHRQTTHEMISVRQAVAQDYVASPWLDRASFFLEHPDLMNWHLEMRSMRQASQAMDRRWIYALVKIDIHEANFLSHSAGALSEEAWAAWAQVIEADFRFAEFQGAWRASERFYAAPFNAYISAHVLSALSATAINIPLSKTTTQWP